MAAFQLISFFFIACGVFMANGIDMNMGGLGGAYGGLGPLVNKFGLGNKFNLGGQQCAVVPPPNPCAPVVPIPCPPPVVKCVPAVQPLAIPQVDKSKWQCVMI